jgi:hypothetical protein
MKETASTGTMRHHSRALGAQTKAEPDGLDAVSDRAAPGGANADGPLPEGPVWSHAPARESPPSAERPITRPRLDPEAKVERGPQTARSHGRTSGGWLRRHLLAIVCLCSFSL